MLLPSHAAPNSIPPLIPLFPAPPYFLTPSYPQDPVATAVMQMQDALRGELNSASVLGGLASAMCEQVTHPPSLSL